MVSHAGSPGQVPEVQFRRILGSSILSTIKLKGRFTGGSFVGNLLQAKEHGASEPASPE